MKETLENKQQPEAGVTKKQWIGKGIYGKKDVPIRILDGLIVGFVLTIIVLVVVFAINGGYYVTFDTDGGSEVSKQKLRYGDHIEMPEEPVKPGYEFIHWVTSDDEYLAEEWNFAENKVETDITLYAVWQPAEMTVKFDLDGGSFPEGNAAVYLAEYFAKDKEYTNPYADNPYDIKSVSIEPDGKMLGANIYKTGVLEILENYKP